MTGTARADAVAGRWLVTGAGGMLGRDLLAVPATRPGGQATAVVLALLYLVVGLALVTRRR